MENFATMVQIMAELKNQYNQMLNSNKVNVNRLNNLSYRVKALKSRIDQYGCRDLCLDLLVSLRNPEGKSHGNYKITLVGILEKKPEDWVSILNYKIKAQFGQGYYLGFILEYKWHKPGEFSAA